MDKTEVKQSIMDAAIDLFSSKGYAAVGIREITHKAGVNSSMISYYFHGKVGILKGILEKYFDDYNSLFDIFADYSKSPEQCLREFVRKMVFYLIENRGLAMVANNMVSINDAVLEDWKLQQMMVSVNKMKVLIKRFGLDDEDIFVVGTIGPALTSIILNKFQRLPVIQEKWKYELNGTVFERFAEVVASLFLDGIHGIAATLNKNPSLDS